MDEQCLFNCNRLPDCAQSEVYRNLLLFDLEGPVLCVEPCCGQSDCALYQKAGSDNGIQLCHLHIGCPQRKAAKHD